MKVKVSEAEGQVLDWLVAKVEEPALTVDDFVIEWRQCNHATSVDWAQGGPIIEREMITVGPAEHQGFMAWGWPKGAGVWGDSPLEAAMRCYIASKLGDEVDVPEVLCEKP